MPLGLILSALLASTTAVAQGPTTGAGPSGNPPSSSSPLLLPGPAALPTADARGATTREDQLEARIRHLESLVNRLSTQIDQMTPAVVAGASRGAATSGGSTVASGGSATPDVGSPASAVAPSASGGAAAPGQSLPPNPPPSDRSRAPATLDNFKANAKFGPGFELRSDNDEYILQFHNLTQFDYRGYEQGGQTSARDTFAFPRQWFMFSGRMTKPFGYFVSLANGFDAVTLLDCFLDVEYDPRLRFRIGRYKTPFTYEFFVEPIQGLVIPERSVFFNNFAQNRDNGIMAYGRLFEGTLDYAVGIFNGPRNGFIDQDDAKDVTAFLNWRPFGPAEGSLLENFNIGGSVFAGNQYQTPIPRTFRTVVPTLGNALVGVPFLALNNNVVNSGNRAFWDLHAAWFYRQLAVIGEWGSGREAYNLTTNPATSRTHLPVQSFYVQASYLLTGETRSSIGIVKPIRPFDIRKGKFGTGAIEPFFRYEYLDIGPQVFTDGLADPNLWANRLYQTHVGFNWHLTQYIKFYFTWNHAEFNQPVLFAPNRRQSTSDLFTARFQIYF